MAAATAATADTATGAGANEANSEGNCPSHSVFRLLFNTAAAATAQRRKIAQSLSGGRKEFPKSPSGKLAEKRLLSLAED